MRGIIRARCRICSRLVRWSLRHAAEVSKTATTPVRRKSQFPQGPQSGLASLRAELLPPLPPGCPPRGSGGYVHEPRWLSMHHKEATMSDEKKNAAHDMNRRNVLLATTQPWSPRPHWAPPHRLKRHWRRRNRRRRGSGPTSSSSWATTSAVRTSAPITEGSWRDERRTSTSSPAEGMLFTDYYAEASCTAGRANFITGEFPIRTGHDNGRPGRRHDRSAGAGAHHCDGAEVDGICHGPVRQEPPGRPERVPADGPRLRRVLRLPLSPRRDGRPVPSQLSAGAEGHGRPTQHGSQLGHRQGRPDRAAALGQNRQAEDRGRGHALSQANGNG